MEAAEQTSHMLGLIFKQHVHRLVFKRRMNKKLFSTSKAEHVQLAFQHGVHGCHCLKQHRQATAAYSKVPTGCPLKANATSVQVSSTRPQLPWRGWGEQIDLSTRSCQQPLGHNLTWARL